MFHAFLLICAVDSYGNEGSCVTINDNWGPYRTEEHCEIRSEQILVEIFEDPFLNFYVGEQLNFAPEVIYDFICIKDEKIDI